MVPLSTQRDELIRGYRDLGRLIKRSRAQIWRDVKAGRIPAPLELGPNSVAWPRVEIEEWIASRPRRTYGSPPPAKVAR
jgi:predicted DNA-binding transcriptional regulator AlpA